MKTLLTSLLFITCLSLAAQTPVYEELIFDSDSTTRVYKPSGKNYALVRSKRGNSGLNKTSRADSILTFPVTEIVLVFSELEASAIAEREEANRERWENLLMTYPEFFQYSTSYKNVCQCNSSADAETLKQAQGFYIYFTGAEPKVEEKKPESKKAVAEASTPVAKAKEVPAAKETPAAKSPSAKKETPVEETKKVEKTKEADSHVAEDSHHDTHATEEAHHDTHVSHEATKPAGKGRVPHAKARRAKDPKACRPPCYQSGDEDLNEFFRQSIVLTKKQKKHGKSLVSMVKLQLDVDGSIKKAIVTGENEGLNKQVQDAVNSMNAWNAEVKAGVTVRAEVKITLKYDPETKGMKPSEVTLNHRAGPQCKCVSDSELFGE